MDSQGTCGWEANWNRLFGWRFQVVSSWATVPAMQSAYSLTVEGGWWSIGLECFQGLCGEMLMGDQLYKRHHVSFSIGEGNWTTGATELKSS